MKEPVYIHLTPLMASRPHSLPHEPPEVAHFVPLQVWTVLLAWPIHSEESA
jgi:hypothetical protein